MKKGLKLTNKEVEAVVTRISRLGRQARAEQIKRVEIHPAITAIVNSDMETYKGLSDVLKEFVGKVTHRDVLEAHVTKYLDLHPLPPLKGDSQLREDVILGCRTLDTIDALVVAINPFDIKG